MYVDILQRKFRIFSRNKVTTWRKKEFFWKEHHEVGKCTWSGKGEILTEKISKEDSHCLLKRPEELINLSCLLINDIVINYFLHNEGRVSEWNMRVVKSHSFIFVQLLWLFQEYWYLDGEIHQ